MRTVTVGHASRSLPVLLDAVQDGETVAISRAGRVVAEIQPRPGPSTAGRLRAALAGLPPLDPDLEADIAAVTSSLTEDGGRWRDA